MLTERQSKIQHLSKEIGQIILTSGLTAIEIIGLLETIKLSVMELGDEKKSKYVELVKSES